MRYYIGIDNGVTGTIAVLSEDKSLQYFVETPAIHEQSYTKKKKNIGRIYYGGLCEILEKYKDENCIAIVERPLVNPGLFNATLSAVRALEATLIALESFNIEIRYIDSKEWQRELLPQGLKGSAQLKKASLDISSRLFPIHKELINKHKDGDALLIAEYARLKNL